MFTAAQPSIVLELIRNIANLKSTESFTQELACPWSCIAFKTPQTIEDCECWSLRNYHRSIASCAANFYPAWSPRFDWDNFAIPGHQNQGTPALLQRPIIVRSAAGLVEDLLDKETTLASESQHGGKNPWNISDNHPHALISSNQ